MDQDRQAAFDRAAKAACAFRSAAGERLMRPAATYAQMLATARQATPTTGCGADETIRSLVELAEPGLHAMIGPRFFGWVIGCSHPVGVAADWLTSAWGQNCGNHQAAPAGAAIETVAASWLLDLLALPPAASVGFVTGATVANFVCLAAARGEVLRRAGWDVEADGLFGAPAIRVLIGEDAHTTVFAALQMLGLGHRRLTRVATDSQGRILPAALKAALGEGDAPTIVILQAGQINTGAFDPFEELLAKERAGNVWVHVDGAFGLWARACPETAGLAAGLDRADSWATDGHKWLQTPYDCGYAIVRDEAAHRRAMTAAASYLPATAGDERDPSHYVPELSRRARGFATWAMIRHLGRTGIAEMVARHCRLARRMADSLRAEAGVEVVNDVVLNQIIVRFGDDEATRAVIARVQEGGVCFVGGAAWRDRWVMRISVISGDLTQADADRSVEAILAAWREVRA